MTGLSERIRQTIHAHDLLVPGDRVIVAVSGGADSTALAHALPPVAPSSGASVVALAHLNHGLRPDADQDEAFCRTLASSLELSFEHDRVDVAAMAQRDHTSIEDAGRTARYAFLHDVADRVGATRIAVAHTRNDQAETVLLKLMRGAGPAGLAGIYPRAGRIIRPLLDASRADVERYLQDAGQSWREDASNRDVTILRNRVRHELLPYLARHFGEGVGDVLARQAAVFREDGEWLDHVATETRLTFVKVGGGRAELEIDRLTALPPAIRRRVVLAVLRMLGGERFVGFAQVEAVLELACGGDTAAARDLPGQRVERHHGKLVFQAMPPDPARAGRRRGRPVSKGSGDDSKA